MLTKTQTAGKLPLVLNPDQHLTAGMRACAAWAAIEEHDKILDMAAGDGALLEHLNDRLRLTVCGICDSPERARAVREKLRDADVIPARMDDIPWRDDTFDVILLPAAMRGEVRRILAEVLRVLRAGGHFVLAFPLLHMRSEGEYSRRELMRLLQEAGFQDVSFRTSALSGVIIGWKQRKCPEETQKS